MSKPYYGDPYSDWTYRQQVGIDIDYAYEQKKILKDMAKLIKEDEEKYFECPICEAQIAKSYASFHAAVHKVPVSVMGLQETTTAAIKRPITIQDAIDAFTKACAALGWEIDINPALAYGDRKGHQIIILPKNKEAQ